MYVRYNKFICCEVQKSTFGHGASVSDWSDKVSNCEITLHLHAIFLAQAYSFHECKKIGYLSLAEIEQGVIGQQM